MLRDETHMTSRCIVLVVGVGGLIVGSLLTGCGKRRPESKNEKTELRDHGTACLRVTGGVFQGPGKRQVEATVTAPDRRSCNDYDFAACTVEQGEHGEILITSTLSLFPPYGRCETGGGPLAPTCHGIVSEGEHEVVFGRQRARHSISLEGSPICLTE